MFFKALMVEGRKIMKNRLREVFSARLLLFLQKKLSGKPQGLIYDDCGRDISKREEDQNPA